MNAWTPALVEERLRKAIGLRARLSDPNLSAGAEGIGTIGGIGGIHPEGGADDVADVEAEALSWLTWLDPVDAGIVLARLEGARWKLICFRFGISRPTADRRWRYALALIAWLLNGHTWPEIPSLRSMLNRRAA